MGKKFERELRGRMISLEELEEWKKKRDAVILAHYYVCLLYTSPSPRDA